MVQEKAEAIPCLRPGVVEAPMSADAKRMAIIVPYRDRAEHLAAFLPHVRRFLRESDALQKAEHTIHVVEQLGTSWFNRGKLLNAGFVLARAHADYFVFHDVDYLPTSADYGWVDRPTRLIWHGLVLREDYDRFFGAVVALNEEHFRSINGFSNEYWGWGPEDVDLRLRCEARGLPIARRDGTYVALPHRHNGFVAPGVHGEQAIATHRLFRERLPRFEEHCAMDGLCTLEMAVEWSRTLDDDRSPRVYHHGVRIG
jgi:N-terminal region of glycosyl transferase group 7/N-terminal domain of galactosyltransferase